MDFKDLKVVILHKHPELMKACCTLINDEWERSETARMMSLNSSRDGLPTSLVLLNKTDVVGHCKLTPIPSIQRSCFVESMVISKPLRGQKLGTYLMNRVEDYCRSQLKLHTIYLSTVDKEVFYAKLGYVQCEPITIYGGPQSINSYKKVPQETNGRCDSKPRKIYMKKNILL